MEKEQCNVPLVRPIDALPSYIWEQDGSFPLLESYVFVS